MPTNLQNIWFLYKVPAFNSQSQTEAKCLLSSNTYDKYNIYIYIYIYICKISENLFDPYWLNWIQFYFFNSFILFIIFSVILKSEINIYCVCASLTYLTRSFLLSPNMHHQGIWLDTLLFTPTFHYSLLYNQMCLAPFLFVVFRLVCVFLKRGPCVSLEGLFIFSHTNTCRDNRPLSQVSRYFCPLCGRHL